MSGVRRVLALVALSSCAAIAVGACESHVPEYAFVDSGEAGEAAPVDAKPPEDVASDMDSASDEAAPPPAAQAHLRFALWSPDIPASDFCVAPHATVSDASTDIQSSDSGPAWMGPLIGQAASAIDGGITTVFDGDNPSGLIFPQVSAYLDVPAGRYEVRLVAAGSADCSAPFLPSDATNLPPFAANTFTTVAVTGDYVQAAKDPAVAVTAFPDDTSASTGGDALRFIAALPSVSLLSLASGTSTLFANVPFGSASNASESGAGMVDTNGFLTFSPLGGVTLSAFSAGDGGDAGGALVAVTGVSTSPGAVVTVAAIGGKSNDTAQPPELLLCLDTAPPVSSVFANCTVLVSPGD